MPESDINRIYNMLERIFERQDDMSRDLAVVKDNSEALDHAVNGNGQPGLLSRVTVIEQRQMMCPARLAVSTAAKQNKISMCSAGIAAIAAVIAAITAIVSWVA
jgi:predicted N-acetyltransferase YhbS